MTEDILFDNLYIGHSPEDAKKLAEETFEVKKRVEAELHKAEAKAEAEEAGDIQTVFKEDPVGFIREKVLEFVELAKIDPIFAAKAKPEVAGGLGLVVLFFIGALFSLISGGSSPKPAAVSLTFVYHPLSPLSAKMLVISSLLAIQEDRCSHTRRQNQNRDSSCFKGWRGQED